MKKIFSYFAMFICLVMFGFMSGATNNIVHSAGCVVDGDCDEFEFCLYEPCMSQLGQCVKQPDILPTYYEPVCGCDGKTYSNDTEAHSKKMGVNYPGECEYEAVVSCFEDSMCSENQFCKFDSCLVETGTCTDLPQICPYIYEPVCGCDGHTYSNQCIADSLKKTIAYEGECKDTIECNFDDECMQNEYCYFGVEGECSLHHKTGVCMDDVEVCTYEYAPVCGCDNITYSNECEARKARVTVAYGGECDVEPFMGGEEETKNCFWDEMCGDSEICYFGIDGECSLFPKTGYCVDNGELCLRIYEPVCGCDNKTYGNECLAKAAGQTIFAQGECEDLPGPFHTEEKVECIDNEMCGEGMKCHFGVEGECDLHPKTGYCVDNGDLCPRYYDPVCGCDNKTYGNKCLARGADQTVLHMGKCKGIGEECFDNSSCQVEGTFCEFHTCEAETGKCALMPEVCPEIYSPVTGCDGQVYGNECEARRAGVSVMTESMGRNSVDLSCDNGSVTCLFKDIDDALILDENQCSKKSDCAQSQFCNFTDGKDLGFCDEQPVFCTEEYLPVCGTDGMTYSNRCKANANGVGMKYAGKCKKDVDGMRVMNLTLFNRVKGKVLLNVDDFGKAYYVNPVAKTLHYLGRPSAAFEVMRYQGIGITNADLAKIEEGSLNGEVSSDKNKLDMKFAKKHLGKIFLQVEDKGQAWYINPADAKRYYLGRPSHAFAIMKKLSLGISNSFYEDLTK